MKNKVAKEDVLQARDKTDADNYEAALIYRSDSERYAGVMQTWADMIMAKGRPTKRGEQALLLDLPTVTETLQKPVTVTGPRRLSMPIVSVRKAF